MQDFVAIGESVAGIGLWRFLFFNSGCLPSWICCVRVRTTHEEYLAVFIHFARFGWNRCSSFDAMQVLICNEFGLKMSIHVLRMEVLGI